MTRPRIALALGLLALLGYSLWWAGSALYAAGERNVQVKWDADTIERNEATIAAAADAREREQVLRDRITRNNQERRNAETKLVADYAAVIASLLHRPDRPSEGAASPGAPAGCTGAGLYRPDGEFLAGEAARADRLRLALRSCEDDYDEVKKAVNGWSPPNGVRGIGQ